jgi:hypothetical protein
MENKEFDYKNNPMNFDIRRDDKKKPQFLVNYNLIDVDSIEKIVEKSVNLIEKYPYYDFEFRIEC